MRVAWFTSHMDSAATTDLDLPTFYLNRPGQVKRKDEG
jgi:hypothetical protein